MTTEIDSKVAQKVLDKAQAEIEKVCKLNGLTLVKIKARYSKDGIKLNAELCTGTKEDKEERDWDKHCHFYGLGCDQRGKDFRVDGKVFTTRTINPRNRQYPIIASNGSDKRKFKFSAPFVRDALRKEAKK